MLEDSDRLLSTIEQILRTGRMGAASRPLNLSRIDIGELVEQCVTRARNVHAPRRGRAGLQARAGDHVRRPTRTKCAPPSPT